MKAMRIFYDLDGSHHEGGSLYANITNKCPCSCTFCIRMNDEAVGMNDSLWLEHEPSLEEIRAAFDEVDSGKYAEVVFCGYGEPMQRPYELIETAKYIKEKTGMRIRINTNGLVKLIEPEFDLSLMKGVIDSVSISLNASNAQKYLDITRSRFGIGSYDAMLDFAKKAKELVPDVKFTIVDVIGEQEVEDCKKRAQELGITLRIREYISNNREYD